ncbi:MAG: flagellar brake protein [Nitrospinae bacterium]|nr:flagellar brake protein [Nitrospinota bacterium]
MGLFDFIKKDGISDDIMRVIFSDDLITPNQIKSNLEEACKRNNHLIATIDERARTFSSTFIELGKGNDFVLIDLLMPKDGIHLIEASNRVIIDYNLEGVMYSFEAKFVEIVKGRFSSIKITFPSVIKKIQKRNAFRVSPSMENPVVVEVKEGLVEEVADISEGGLSFYTRRAEEELSVGTIFEKLTFKLQTMHGQITIKAVVRSFIKASVAGVKNKCCVEFMNMRMADKDAIAHYVVVRQREIIIKMKGER